MSNNITECQLQALAAHLLVAKGEEEKAKQLRIALEIEIAERIPGPEIGSKTVTLSDGTKLTVERGFNYKAELSEIDDLFLDSLPPPIKTKTTRELDVNGYEWFRENHPILFNEISKYVTVTPKKTAVTIKVKT